MAKARLVSLRDRLLERSPAVRRAILLLIVAGTPVFFLRMANGIFGVPKLGLLMAGVSIVAAIRGIELMQGSSSAGLTRLAVPGLALGLPLLLAWAASPYRYWSLFGWYPRFLGLIPYLVIILYGVFVADAFAGRVHQLAWAMVIAATIVGGYGLVQVIGADPFEWRTAGAGTSVANSTLGNSNFAGGFLAMTFPFHVGLWITQPDQRRRVGWMFVIAAGGWILSLSEAAWVAGVGGLAVMIGWTVSSRWRGGRLIGLGTAAASAAGLIGIVLYRMINPGTIDSITFRGWWWRAAVDMVQSSPLLGRGPAAFAVEGVRYRPLEDALAFNYSFPDDPHSVVLSLVTAGGVVALIGFLTLLVWVIRKGFSIPDSQMLPAAFFASVIAYFVNSTTTIDEISLRVALWTGIAGLSASLVPLKDLGVDAPSAQNKKRKGSAKATKTPRRTSRAARPLRALPAVLVVALMGLVGVLWSVGFLLADARVRQAQALFAQDRVEEGNDEFETAIGYRGDYAYRDLYGLNLGSKALERGREGKPLIDRMRSTFAFVDGFPYVPSRVDYALKLYEWGDFDAMAYQEALELFEEARRFDPLNPLLRIQTADALIALERHQEAIELLTPFTDQAGDQSAEAWGALALAHFAAGDLDAAQDALDRGLAIDPGAKRILEAQDLLAKGAD